MTLALYLIALVALATPCASFVAELRARELATAVWNAPAPAAPYFLAAVVLVRDEDRYLVEWLLYHYLLGYEHFYVYDNDDAGARQTAVASLLAPFTAKGLVTIVPWQTFSPGGQDGPGGNIVGASIGHAFFRSAVSNSSRWLTYHDVDEFLVTLEASAGQAFLGSKLRGEHRLHQYLDLYDKRGVKALLVDRLDFGTSGHADPPSGLVIENYTRRRVVHGPRAAVVGKMFVRPEFLKERSHHGHTVELTSGLCATTDFETSANNSAKCENFKVHRRDPLRLHHYATKSFNECEAKFKRGHFPANDWRAIHGLGICERAHPGKPGFVDIEHGHDITLSASTFPPLIKQLAARIQKQ